MVLHLGGIQTERADLRSNSDEVLEALATSARGIAKQRLIVRGVTHLDQLTMEDSKPELRWAWHEAAAQYFPNAEPHALKTAVDELLEAMIAGAAEAHRG